MDPQEIQLPHHHQIVLDRFIAACRADERVVAAFLSGSYARGAADTYSDLDIDLITTDAAYEEFHADHAAFIRLLGEPVFLEFFDLPNTVFFIFPDGTECELALGRESHLTDMHGGPYRVLLDKTGILVGAVFPSAGSTEAEQIETLRRLVYWFWHDLSHFTTAIARRQLWWAHGQLEELRRLCVNLARLKQNFSASADGYEKVEHALPAEQLAPLQATYCPLEHDAMLRAALVIVHFYRELAAPLAQAHGIAYPDNLDHAIYSRLEQLYEARLGTKRRPPVD